MPEQCAICGAPFGSPAELLAHTNKDHSTSATAATGSGSPAPRARWFACALCGEPFRTPEELRRHNLAPHPRAPLPRARPTG